MATETLINPFSIRYGTTVPSELYVSRPVEEAVINQRVLGPYYSNLSVVGLPKTGKSTIVSHCLVEQADNLAKEKTLIVYYQMGSTRSAMDFYKKIAKKFDSCFSLYYSNDEKYKSFVRSLVEDVKKAEFEEDATDLLDDYFKRTRHLGYKLILILDEFDRSQEIFTFEDFQFLREISYEAKDKICLVTCSRKPLNDLEKKAPQQELSLFAMTFKTCQIAMYDEQNIKYYWKLAKKYWDFNEQDVKFVEYVAGNNPWLMDIVNDFLFEHQGVSDNVKLLAGIKASLMEGYDHLIRVLSSESLLNAAVQLVEGPLFDVTPVQVEKLLQYGFLKVVTPEKKRKIFNGIELGPIIDGYSYVCFSEYCSLDFYRRYYANVPYVALWSDTENLLRYAVKEFLKANFSDDWEIDLANSLRTNPPFHTFPIDKWKKNFESLKTNRDRMIQNFPSMNGGHLVDFTLTAQIFDIFIRPNWKWFNTYIFKGTREEWNNKFEFLTILRNPVAHNNIIGNMEEDMRIARDYCQEVSSSIKEWQKKRITKNVTT